MSNKNATFKLALKFGLVCIVTGFHRDVLAVSIWVKVTITKSLYIQPVSEETTSGNMRHRSLSFSYTGHGVGKIPAWLGRWRTLLSPSTTWIPPITGNVYSSTEVICLTPFAYSTLTAVKAL